jgi:hypothetical protein
VHIPTGKVEISKEKITDYLLVRKVKNDKSKFLLRLGYSIENWKDLENDIIKLVENNEAYLQSASPFGELYEVRGTLRNFEVVSIWLLTIGKEKFKFVTLFPSK